MAHRNKSTRLVIIVAWGLVVGVLAALSGQAWAGGMPAAAQAISAPSSILTSTLPITTTAGQYKGPDFCKTCHNDIHAEWTAGRHALAFSSPVFQQDWKDKSSQTFCLSCHTTGYNPNTGQYAIEGVTCESCHGPWQAGHPKTKMPVQPTADLCAQCHKSTTDEWKASKHGQVGIQCESCHEPHKQGLLAATVTELCTNCHKDRMETFTHGTHAQAGLQCANCHMYTSPRTGPPTQGLVSSGHTFTVGSDACVGCHQDTVHSRSTIVSLSGEVAQLESRTPEELRQATVEQEKQIKDLQTRLSTRLYVGLVQGAVVGLAVGAVAAWIISKRLSVVEMVIQDEPAQNS